MRSSVPRTTPDTIVNVVNGIRQARLRKGSNPIRRPSLKLNSRHKNLYTEPQASYKFPNKENYAAQVIAEDSEEDKKKSEDIHELVEVAQQSHDILFKTNTVFPFTLFPDTVSLDREMLTVATRYFFKIAKITSVPVRDILSVEANVGPFFGSLRTSSRYFITNPYNINFLKRSDTLALQRLLQGYIIVHEQEIDCTDISTKDLKKLLNELGEGDTD